MMRQVFLACTIALLVVSYVAWWMHEWALS